MQHFTACLCLKRNEYIFCKVALIKRKCCVFETWTLSYPCHQCRPLASPNFRFWILVCQVIKICFFRGTRRVPLKRSKTLRKTYFFHFDNSSLSRGRLRISLNQNLAYIKFLTHPTSPYSFKKCHLATIFESPHFFHATKMKNFNNCRRMHG